MSITTAPESAPETALPLECAFGKSLISDNALHALREYSSSIGNPQLSQRAYRHPLRTASLVYDFVGSEIDPRVYDAVALHDVGQRAETDPAALHALRTYAAALRAKEGEKSSTWIYVSTLLADLNEVEACSERGRRANLGNVAVSALLGNRSQSVLPDDWKVASKMVGLKSMYELLREVNLESVLIKSGEMFDNLRHPAPTDRSVLQDVFDAQAFYAPISEVLSFDGQSMGLRGIADEIRLERSGNGSALRLAREARAARGDNSQVLASVTGLANHLLQGEVAIESSVTDISGHGVLHGTSVLYAPELSGSDELMELVWRRKTDGSEGAKRARLYKRPADLRSGKPAATFEQSSADILGMTLVVDADKLPMVYAGLVRCIKDNGVVRERPAPSRHQAYSIQGDATYQDTISSTLITSGIVGEGELDVPDPRDDGYRVAKATFELLADEPSGVTPVELVVMDPEAYAAGKLGPTSHFAYKAATAIDPILAASINHRRIHLRSGQLNPRSAERGKRLRALVG